MSDDSLTERFDTPATPAPDGPDRRWTLLLPSLAAIGGVVLMLVIMMVVTLVARGGATLPG
ncbi:hypothetical protein ACVXZ4_15110 [Lacisediminihabitans sp. FW035]